MRSDLKQAERVLDNEWRDRLNDYRARIEKLEAMHRKRRDAMSALADMVRQHCHQDPKGVFDSGALRANANAIRLLVSAGVMKYAPGYEDGGISRIVQASFV